MGTAIDVDVAIIGGGPAGTTAATLLKKYNPDMNVLVLEREKFPREHVGESLLPQINLVLQEMGAWDKVEAANFPVKVGATYRWGNTDDLWDLDFLPGTTFKEQARPGKYKGQRTQTAFQVDRSIYDTILLEHARGCGADVREKTKVVTVERDGDKVTGLKLEDGSTATARYYIDASGHSGILRRAMGVETDVKTSLMNVAFWSYWQNAEWAVSIGVGGTRIQVMSLGYGWIWFIPIGETRTSIGLVIPAEYYKKTGKRPEELYYEALKEEPLICKLLAKATEEENNFHATKDWSFCSSRMSGENWFLCGESAGFADPILSAGLTIAHTGAREAAYVIHALDRGDHEKEWLQRWYDELQTRRVNQHIRFADYWYTANSHNFTELREFTRTLAADAGIELDAEKAWLWLSRGGFASDGFGRAGYATFSLKAAKAITSHLLDGAEVTWEFPKYNIFKLNMLTTERQTYPILEDGRIEATHAYVRGEKILPVGILVQAIIWTLESESRVEGIMGAFQRLAASGKIYHDAGATMSYLLQAFDAMLVDGWITAAFDSKRPRYTAAIGEKWGVHKTDDIVDPKKTSAAKT